ncbi:nucleoside triphosphate pyrophosphohydrolase family protein [Burkholderia multivorans]|uniref:nucleoside triphosphate pyrophosphohydrolase family protein n=1 Tax=Burkholderia multivorans TaxID=87883 RepID=UPI001C213B40|nr:nucleoside triphosphate pyrophosphohydrolase family protein [Burkholderia multivorans]MBU9605977.1 nucleoside triphosphate pyrophosphohydrolase family protein [Burkholderia multivorans]MBU9625588.1 nucleoside triphosphate pyrophosphohydrolase family protein [Burkholderia multivorans]
MFNPDNSVRNSALPLSEYEARASASNQFKGTPEAFNQLRYGLFGEVGGILAAIKKSKRDLGPAEQANVTEEIGDALWYLTTVGIECQHSLNELGVTALEELQRRLDVKHIRSTGDVTFAEFDGLIAFCRSTLASESRTGTLCGLGAHCGQLMAISSVGDLGSHSSLELLGSLLADMVLVCAQFGLSVAQIAKENLEKFESRWPREGTAYHALFDDSYSELEQLPRKLTMRFIELHGPDGVPYVVQQMNGVNIGDRLTDNRTEPDGYRFHDVFHLAYIAHLGWSPVVRGLLKLKRKSNAQVDRDEDGARAMIIEEGIATWIFNHAYRHRYFTDTAPGKLDYGVLKQVREMVKGYEVYACPLWQWEKAILEGFKVFRELCEAGGGEVTVDMNAHTITFSPIREEEKPTLAVVAPKKKMIVGAVPPDFE